MHASLHSSRLSFALAAILIVTLISACSSGPSVVANQDPTTDFNAIKTFNFVDPLSTDHMYGKTILSTHLMTETARQLDARGLRRDRENPDVLIDFAKQRADRVTGGTAPSSTVSMGRGYGGYGGTRTSVGIGYSTGSAPKTTTYGTVIISMIDPQRKQVVWEAMASGRVSDKVKQNIGPAVEAAVNDMFTKYPVQPPKKK